MQNKNTKPKKSVQKNPSSFSLIRVDFILIIMAYAIVPIAMPILNAFDANGPKFLAIAVLNLLTFIYFCSIKIGKSYEDVMFNGFRNWIGIVYLLFLLAVLLSFFKAINIYESIITFSKIFTIFSAAYLISVILFTDKKYLTWVSIAFMLMLVFDSLTVIFHIWQYLSGTVESIYVIKSVYSNKNILSAALFVKIPFVLYLFSFDKRKWLRTIALITLFVALLATLFMSTRTFYLGIIGLSLAYLSYALIRYFRERQSIAVFQVSYYFGALILAIVIFSFTQKFLYPKESTGFLASEYNSDLVTRISSISGGEGGRNKAWGRTIKLISEDPILGVGTGNWKVAVLKYENKESHDYTYMYKNHNDFLEVTAETGIIGGLLFLSIFLLIGCSFVGAFLKHDANEPGYSMLFLPAFGLLAYSFDAFFNFPADRPEIGALFAMYVACGIAYAPSMLRFGVKHPATQNAGTEGTMIKRRKFNASRVVFSAVMIGVMVGALYVFYMNYKSIVLQRIVKSEMATGKLITPSEKFMTGFPFFPTLSLEGEPIAVHKARYLISENKFREAIAILKPDQSSPYDTRQEFFISMAYYQLGMTDSSIYYSKKVFDRKPLFFNNTSNLCRSLDATGKSNEAFGIMDTYLNTKKDNGEAWIFTAALHDKAGDYRRAAIIMDSAVKYLPEDTAVVRQYRIFQSKVKIKPLETLYFSALETFKQKKYQEAIKLLSQFIDKEPTLADAYDFRAFAYFFTNDHKKSLADIEHALALGPEKPNLLNLRGVNNHMLGNNEAACKDFQKALSLGDRDAVENMKKFCQKFKYMTKIDNNL